MKKVRPGEEPQQVGRNPTPSAGCIDSQSIKTSVVQLQRTANSASVVTDNIKQASERLNRNDNALGVALKDTAFAGKLKSTMQNLETSSRKLDQNMEALQHNFLLRGYFRKKAKRDTRGQADSTAR